MVTKVIDALLMTLGLDVSEYKKGQEEATKELKKTKRAVASASDDMSRAIKGASREFALAFLGFASAAGLVKLLANLNEASRRVGLLGLNTGNAARDLKKYANAFEVAGGSAEGFLGTIQKIQSEQSEARLTGISAWQPFLRTLQIASGNDWAFKNQKDILLELADAFQKIEKMPGQGRPMANSIGLRMGIDQDTLNVLLQGRDAIGKLVDKQEALTRGYDRTAAAAGKLRQSFIELKQKGESQLLVLLQQLQPHIEKLFRWLSKLADNGINSGDWSKAIVKGLESITDAARVLWGVLKGISDMFATFSEMGNWISSTAGKILDSPVGKWIIEKSIQSETVKLTSTQDARARYAPVLADAERNYGLPAGTLQTLAERSTGWSPTLIQSTKPLRTPLLSRLSGGPQRGDTSGAGLLGLPKSQGPEVDAENGAAMLADLMYRALETVKRGVGVGTVLEPGFAQLGMAAMTGQNPLQAAQGSGVGAGTVLRPTPGAQNTNTLQIDNLTIQTQATDAAGIVATTEAAIRRRFDLAQADYGMR